MLIETARCGTLWAEDLGPTGSGPRGLPVVLWHSVLCDGSMWSTLPQRLREAGHRVINLDAPGHGKSAPTRKPYTMDDCVDAALSVLDACGIERAIWCGLSWGGMVGMRLAIRAPERVAQLVLMDTNADKEVPEKLPRYRAMAWVTRVFGPLPPILRRLPPIYFSPVTLEQKPEIVATFLRNVAAMDRHSIRHVVDAIILGRDDVRPRLGAIRVPTLILVGSDDQATPLARSLDIAQGISGSRLVEIPAAGHLSSWEQPAIVAHEILSFLGHAPPQHVSP